MLRAFEKIPEWITAGSSRALNQVVSSPKTMRIKLAVHICDERQTELVIMELADDSFFVPAIFKPNEIRKKFGLSDLSLSIDVLEERIVKINTYAVSAYRSNNSLYPYLIITDFEYNKGRSRIDDGLQHVYTVKQVEDWINHVQQGYHNQHEPVSKMFMSSELMAQYPNLATLECHLEAILSRMYKFPSRTPPANITSEREQPNSMRNYAGRGNTPSQALHGSATHEPLAAASPMIEWPSSNLQHVSPPPPASQLTLQEYLLSTFDTTDEIPDELCIDSGYDCKEETQASTPSPSSPQFVAASPDVNLSPATCVATSFSPEPMSYPSYSPGPSPGPFDSNRQTNLYNPMLPGRLQELPPNADSFKRRRECSDFRHSYYSRSPR